MSPPNSQFLFLRVSRIIFGLLRHRILRMESFMNLLERLVGWRDMAWMMRWRRSFGVGRRSSLKTRLCNVMFLLSLYGITSCVVQLNQDDKMPVFTDVRVCQLK